MKVDRVFKKSELVQFRVHVKKRSENLADAFLRNVPYRTVERKTHWDSDPNHKPGEIVFDTYGWSVAKLCFPFFLDRPMTYADTQTDEGRTLLELLKEWFLKPALDEKSRKR